MSHETSAKMLSLVVLAEAKKKRHYDRLPILKIDGITMIFLREMWFSMERKFSKTLIWLQKSKILIKAKIKSYVKNFYKIEIEGSVKC